jgi:hypothetical protein
MTISVIENSDGTFTIDWDQEDPKESVLNDWTEEDFIECIRSHCEEVIAKSDDPDNEEVSIEDIIENAINQRQEVATEGEQGSENTSQIDTKDEEYEVTGARIFF